MRCAFPIFIPLALMATACGGGGGSGAPAPAANQPPAFTSSAATSIAENVTAAYQASATDPEGAPLAYSIAGGADAGAFAITGAGALSFTTPPNFEAPADIDGDNVYRVTLRASDGSQSATLDLAVTVTNSREGIAVRRVATGLNQPIQVAPIPGSSDVFLIEKGGNIYRLTPSSGARSLLKTVTGLTTDGERGLLGITAAPDYATSGAFYVYCTVAAGTIEIQRYVVNPGTGAVGGPTTLLSIPHPTNNNHNGGWLGFGPDGYLYIAVGDGGGAGDPGNNAQNVNVKLGKILRIAVNPATGAVTYPATNPYAAGGGDPAIYAIGMRNPFRNSFDGNRLLIADVGQDAIEEIDSLLVTQPGLNFGWPFKEGTQTYRGTPPAGLIDPVSQYDHGSGPRQGNSIIGGFVYTGPVTSLLGSYVFGDYVSKNIWSVAANRLVPGVVLPSSAYERRNLDFTPDVGTIDLLVSFGIDTAGNLYLVDIDGDLFEVVPG